MGNQINPDNPNFGVQPKLYNFGAQSFGDQNLSTKQNNKSFDSGTTSAANLSGELHRDQLTANQNFQCNNNQQTSSSSDNQGNQEKVAKLEKPSTKKRETVERDK